MSVRTLLTPLIVAAKTPAQREALASALRTLADELEAEAQALRRQQAKPGPARLTPKARQAGPGRAPSRFVRIERMLPHGGERTQERLLIYIGRGLWYDLGSPKRFDVQSLSGQLMLRPATGDQGYALNIGEGMPRFYADGLRDLFDHLEDGRYDARLEAGAIIIGTRITEDI